MYTNSLKERIRRETNELAVVNITPENYPGEDLEHIKEYVRKNMDRYLDTLLLIPDISENRGRRILDIGIAYGYHDVVLKRQGYDIYGTEQIDRITRHCAIPLREGIEICELDLCTDDLPFEDGFFDIILLGEVFEHIRESPVRVLKRLGRMLRPGGHLILTTPNFCRVTNIGMLLFRRNPLEPFDTEYDSQNFEGHITDSWTHIREYTAEELQEYMKGAGFEVEEIRMSTCWDTYWFNLHHGGFSKGKRHISFLLYLLNKLFTNYRSDIMIRARKL